jgi:hypothetical protein
MRNKPVEFRAPDGVVPEGTSEGEDFDLVTTYRMKGDGNVCLVKIGDVDMPGEGKEKAKGSPDYSDMSQDMVQSQTGG